VPNKTKDTETRTNQAKGATEERGQFFRSFFYEKLQSPIQHQLNDQSHLLKQQKEKKKRRQIA